MSKFEVQDSKFELKYVAMKSLYLKVDENEKKSDEIDGKLVEMKMSQKRRLNPWSPRTVSIVLGK